MEYISARQHPCIVRLGQEVLLANHALFPNEALIRRLDETHQVRFVEPVAVVVLALLGGNPQAVLLGAALAELGVEQRRVNGAGVTL